MKKWLMILYIKWIGGQCRHLCMFCDFRNQCESDFEYSYPDTFKQIHQLKKKQKNK